jgi:3-oxoacyl-[acyl-carrier protein] reductase
MGSDLEKWLTSQAPLGRTGQVGDLAPTAVFLASDDSQWLTGEQLLATGGIRLGNFPATTTVHCRRVIFAE